MNVVAVGRKGETYVNGNSPAGEWEEIPHDHANHATAQLESLS